MQTLRTDRHGDQTDRRDQCFCFVASAAIGP
jgi:hypothetical protein